MSAGTETEVTGPRLTGSKKDLEIRAARKYYKQVVNGGLMFSAHLRKLQEGEAHKDPKRPYASFADFAIAEIAPELTKSAIERFSWQGAPLLVLARTGRMRLSATYVMPVGTTGSRALAKILTNEGEAAMLEAFDLARSLKPGAVSDATIARAQRELNPSKQKTLKAAAKDQLEEAAEPEPYVSDQDERYDPAELPEELEQMRGAFDEWIDDLTHAEITEPHRQRSVREIEAILIRAARLKEMLA